MTKRIIRVGFDLDGVLLYNPVRVFRPVATAIKPFILKKTGDKIYFPKSKLEQFVWKILHKTSYRLNDGIDEIRKLSVKGEIDAFIITARYSFLKKDFDYWLKEIEAKNHFKHSLYNKDDQQPNIFKQNMIEKLELDYFVEDNWGIVQRLNNKLRTKTKVLWLSNFLDRKINYPYKFFNLKQIAKFLKKI